MEIGLIILGIVLAVVLFIQVRNSRRSQPRLCDERVPWEIENSGQL